MPEDQSTDETAAAAQPPSAPAAEGMITDEIVEVSVRRAPKYAVFVTVGAALGVIVALILTFAFDGTAVPAENGAVYSDAQVFGFLALIGAAVGVLLGGLVALLFDRTMGRHTREVHADRENVVWLPD